VRSAADAGRHDDEACGKSKRSRRWGRRLSERIAGAGPARQRRETLRGCAATDDNAAGTVPADRESGDFPADGTSWVDALAPDQKQ
jgi:hypothetical protein